MRASLEGFLPSQPGLALLMGVEDEVGRDLGGRGWNVVTASEQPDFGVAPTSCDLVAVRDMVAREPWGRWSLQRLHHALRPGGLLALDEPQLFDLSTPGGIAYLGGRAMGELGGRARRALGLDAGRERPASGRRLTLPAVRTLLEGLRFELLVLALERDGGWSHVLPRGMAPRLTAVARALPSIAGVDGDRPDLEAHRVRYEHDQANMLATRRQWMAAHPEWVTDRPAEFDPKAYAGRPVVVLAPHPDDEVIGAGGAILELVRAGARVACVQATDGSQSAAFAGWPEQQRRTRRLEEAAAVSRAMGMELECWQADNRCFRVEPAWVSRLARRLERERPALVMVPFVTEAHADHLTLARILSRALSSMSLPLEATILGYEVWSLVPPSLVHDISARMRELERLLFLYDTAMKVDDFVHYCADRGLYHGITLRGTTCHLEAFHAVTAGDYPALLRTVCKDEP